MGFDWTALCKYANICGNAEFVINQSLQCKSGSVNVTPKWVQIVATLPHQLGVS